MKKKKKGLRIFLTTIFSAGGCFGAVGITGAILAFIAAAIAALLIFCVVFGLVLALVIVPSSNYNQAVDNMENGNYQEAADYFLENMEYKDSESLYFVCKEEIAQSYLDDRDYDGFVTYILDSASMESIFAPDPIPADTYLAFTSFKIATIDYDRYYNSVIQSKLFGDDTIYRYSDSSRRSNAIGFLELLPATHTDAQNTLSLLNSLQQFYSSGGDSSIDFVKEYSWLASRIWDTKCCRDFFLNDDRIAAFMLGTWETYDGRYYLQFYVSPSGGISSSYNLPTPTEPYGTKYYDICDLCYVWTDEDENILEIVYKFEFIDANTVAVFSYANYGTYYLYR